MKTLPESREAIKLLAKSRGSALPHSLQKKLQDTADLEPLQTIAAGQRMVPDPGQELIIHVDSLRMFSNKEFGISDPIIRVINGDVVIHCRAIEMEGPSQIAEDYENPLHDRENAVCVLKTKSTVKVLR